MIYSTIRKQVLTLLEFVITLFIIAVLATVGVPLMSGHHQQTVATETNAGYSLLDRAMATEAMVGCAMIDRAMRIDHARHGRYRAYRDDVTALPGIAPGDLNGTYFQETDYRVRSGRSGSSFTVDVRRQAAGVTKFNDALVRLSREADKKEWGGALME